MTTSNVDALVERARKLRTAGRLAEAEQALQELETLARQAPDRLYYCAHLAIVLDELGRTDEAIERYRRFLARQPRSAAAHFNVALLYKKNKQYAEALGAYEAAARLGIDRVQEVYSNMGVLYSDMRAAGKAAEMYERALAIDPAYVPALFNRAALFEECGEREKATELYERILSHDPRHWDSLARLAHARTITPADGELVRRLERAADAADGDFLAQEGLYFALGKALDDLGQYERAYAAYRAGNALGRRRNPPYDRIAAERAVDLLIETFEAGWMSEAGSGSTASPIFICGMFRSGSTLVEQILAAHPAVTAGGELDILPRIVSRRLAPYPQGARNASREALQRLADEYLVRVRDLLGDAAHATDKRPDNFVHLGLVKLLFPKARIVYTKRNRADNCLSVYFQQLGGNLSYATDLDDIAHYYAQQERLMSHWLHCFPENLFTVDYDELVRSPRPVLSRLLAFLGLEWDERCLAFQDSPTLVKTASVWQVREPLHARSSGRWRHYAPFMAASPLLSREGR